MESTLSLPKTKLESQVGDFLGYGRGASAGDTTWTTKQFFDIDEAVKSGLRQFYFPPPIEGMAVSYDWSFLRPFLTLTLLSGAVTVALPDDFGGIEGQITLSTGGTDSWWPVDVYNPGRVKIMHAEQPSRTGQPEMASIEAIKGTGAREGQRERLYFFPTADQDYTISFQYYVHPNALTGDRPYAYGGAAHSETILAACKMAAEESKDDARGVWAQKFQERLLASISIDRKHKPQLLGYNGDRSHLRDRRDFRQEPRVTFNGTLYGSN